MASAGDQASLWTSFNLRDGWQATSLRYTNRVNRLPCQGLSASRLDHPEGYKLSLLHVRMNEPSATSLLEGGLGEPAARIPSLSTLLRWVSQHSVVITGTSRRRDQAVAEFLDSVALMFVSGRRCSDAAAVIPTSCRGLWFDCGSTGLYLRSRNNFHGGSRHTVCKNPKQG